MSEKIVSEYLQKIFPDSGHIYLRKLQEFVDLLWDENQKINLISRKMNKKEYWLTHIYDSLSLSMYANLNGKKVLDFGSGGGLPGIPLNIVFPESEMYLLDSTQKKIAAVEKFIKILDLKTCLTIRSRLEDIKKDKVGRFDMILCRSVKMEARYLPILRNLLKEEGRIFLYKGKKYDDIRLFKSVLIHEIRDEYLGEKKIIEIKRNEI